ncbi:bifunctional phosphopantothenoylcysteine decarboxylase/phosphopantothenate--cysteine ligase CoaBC [Alphaproteobacteria bacterium]|nr:bifunctional phosphopantothenoylcysteine decarboxylase/phosphopantothenate--cysteine ligase CoaBC [Alphaproteobacteria bacterium]
MKILFIVSASVAIKKCAEIFKSLSSKNISIDCIITKNSKKMINLKELKKTISGKIYSDLDEKNNKMLHIDLTRKSDLIIVCPATSNIIAKYSNGIADDLASTALIASNKNIFFIPAMNSEMWNNKINQKNVLNLKNLGIQFIGPEYGRLSCGEVGLGRLTNTKTIANSIVRVVKKTQIFKNMKCLITAGPTIEPIDPIRNITNNSSGKQGYEIARQMILSGATVTLISGPTNIQAPLESKLIKVKTAKEMYKAVKKNIKVDIAIFAAAVSDLTPLNKSKNKIKKDNLQIIKLKKNKDILKEVSHLKKNRPKVIVGFAAETKNHISNAKKKLLEKKCDAIIVNKIDKYNDVFNSDFNKVTFITKNKKIDFKKMSKIKIAKHIVELIEKM